MSPLNCAIDQVQDRSEDIQTRTYVTWEARIDIPALNTLCFVDSSSKLVQWLGCIQDVQSHLDNKYKDAADMPPGKELFLIT